MCEPLRWTRERPTEPGWYWYRWPNGSACIVEIHRGPFCLTHLYTGVLADGEPLPDGDGHEWSDRPIAGPEEGE